MSDHYSFCIACDDFLPTEILKQCISCSSYWCDFCYNSYEPNYFKFDDNGNQLNACEVCYIKSFLKFHDIEYTDDIIEAILDGKLIMNKK